MKIAIKLMVLSILLNLACGIVIQFLPEFQAQTDLGKVTYNGNQTQLFINAMNGSINPTPDVSNAGDLIRNILDKVTLGVVTKIQIIINTYMFGFVTIIADIFQLDSFSQGVFLHGVLVSLIIIAYTFAVINLLTGKDFRE